MEAKHIKTPLIKQNWSKINKQEIQGSAFNIKINVSMRKFLKLFLGMGC